MQELRVTPQTDSIRDRVIENIHHSHKLGLPLVGMYPAHDGVVSICGSGASINDTYKDLQGDIWAVNGSHDWLLEKGIKPQAAFLFDAAPVMTCYTKSPQKETIYYLATHCHPDVFKSLEGYDVRVFHTEIGHDIQPEIEKIDWFGPIYMGGCAGVTRAMSLAYGLGYREFHLHGADSSISKTSHIDRDEAGHVYDIHCMGREFKAHAWMAAQAKEIVRIPKFLKDAKILVHGDGLLPHIARMYGMHINN